MVPVFKLASARRYVIVAFLPHGRVNVGMSRVATTTSVPVYPLQPMLGTVTSDQVLEVIGDGNILGLSSSQEVLSNRVCIVPKRNLDGTFEAMDITVVAGSLVCLMLFHQRKELLGGPALGLKVIVV